MLKILFIIYISIAAMFICLLFSGDAVSKVVSEVSRECGVSEKFSEALYYPIVILCSLAWPLLAAAALFSKREN